MSNINFYPGDNRGSLQRLIDQGVQVHSIVCDPPYGLDTITDRFSKEGCAPAKVEGTDGSFARLSRGFMNQKWDGTGIERDPAFWKLLYDILLPGGFCFAFSSPRTGHRQACAMEDAGFVMHNFHVWAYSTGLPKGKNVQAFMLKNGVPTDDADEWQGWKFGGQSQKPAIEPIYLAQKPLGEKTNVLNILKHGVGAVNIDECRVPLDPIADESLMRQYVAELTREPTPEEYAEITRKMGRYPTNLLHDASDSVLALFPKSGNPSQRRDGTSRLQDENLLTEGEFGEYQGATAARYFHGFEKDDCPPLLYHPKANKADRAGSNHPTVKPVGLIRHLIRHITPPGGTVLDPFAGSGTTAVAAQAEGMNCILMEAEDSYIEFLYERFGRSISEDLADTTTDELLV